MWNMSLVCDSETNTLHGVEVWFPCSICFMRTKIWQLTKLLFPSKGNKYGSFTANWKFSFSSTAKCTLHAQTRQSTSPLNLGRCVFFLSSAQISRATIWSNCAPSVFCIPAKRKLSKLNVDGTNANWKYTYTPTQPALLYLGYVKCILHLSVALAFQAQKLSHRLFWTFCL